MNLMFTFLLSLSIAGLRVAGIRQTRRLGALHQLHQVFFIFTMVPRPNKQTANMTMKLAS